MPDPQPPTRVVIVGGGFGGVYTAVALAKAARSNPRLKVTLVSKHNYFLMTPLLFEAGSGVLEARHAVSPIRRLSPGIEFVEAAAEQIDLQRRVITARRPHDGTIEVAYDQLVLALGEVTNRSIPGAESARTFKTVRDAIDLRNHCIRMFELADVETDPERRKRMLTFTIVGGGLVGVELQGELSEFIRHVLPTYKRITPEQVRFELIHAGPRLMPELQQDLGEYAQRTFARRGVNVRLNSPVERIDNRSVYLKDGSSFESDTIIVAAGLSPNPLTQSLPLEKNRHGRIVVDATMRCPSDPAVWALGDCAAIPDANGNPYPPLAQHALRESRTLAHNILAALQNQPLKPFIYKSKGTLASLGGRRGVGRVYGLKIFGVVAWWVWRTYYLMQMPRLDRRLRIMIDWTVALFFRYDVVELDLSRE